ncbi:MAG: iron ABC transporter permease [Spirochaetales bacterium]|nr:iron ABC transporter permease [Spirochaetales bacterium]
MHLEEARFPAEYQKYIGRKIVFLFAALALLLVLFLFSLSVGVVTIPVMDVLKTLAGMSADPKLNTIIFNVRLLRVLTAVFAGIGLAVSGAVMQSVLRNPLGSPFTLGISQAAAFGAALSIMILGAGVVRSGGENAVVITNPYLTTICAFVFCLLTTGVLIGIARLKRTSAEVMILTGVAMGFLFSAGIMFLQYFADDVQLGAMVFWTFGDAGRTKWLELVVIMVVVTVSIIFFISQRWRYNALDAGDETAKSLGVPVEAVRLSGMVTASLVTAVIIAFIGIIGFIGLVCPHIVRRIIGDDHRFLLPGSCIAGGIILLGADICAQFVMAPRVFSVAIFTAFLGVPMFVYLIIKGRKR